MLIGLPKETALGESRVAIASETAKKLKKQGHSIRVQSGAGVAASVPDEANTSVGAEITDATGAYAADIVLKVRCPLDAEIAHVKPLGVLVGMLNPFDATGLQQLERPS
jgi:NAD(P) transhydrogenase subunit alpha